MSKPERKLKNYLIDPFAQVRIGVIVVGMMAVLEACLLVFSYYFLKDFTAMLIELTDIPEDIIPQAQRELEKLFMYLSGFSVLVFIITFMLVVLETHKIVGAGYAINRFINDNLLKGIYGKKLILRHGDHLQNLADSVNTLSEHLNQDKK